jgi:hypothetical protein
MNDSDRTYLKALPLLLMSSFLMIGAAWAFFQGKDGTASIAAFASGLILLGAWLTTAIVDWSHNKPQVVRQEEELDEQS